MESSSIARLGMLNIKPRGQNGPIKDLQSSPLDGIGTFDFFFFAYCTLIFFFLWWCEKLRRVTLTDPSSTNLPYQFFLFFLCPLFTGRGTATSCKRWSVSNPMENLTQNSFLEKYKKKDVGNYNSFFFYSHILGIIDGKKNIREHTYIFSCRALITCSSLITCNAFTSV